MKKIFVTGVTGLLGANVVIKLLKDGYFVIALVRKESGYLGEKNENLKLVEGDLSADITPFLKEVDCIIHIAAETRHDLIHYKDYRAVNFESVIHLFTLAEQCGVRRFIFISTANTLGFGTKESPGTEKDEQQYPFTKSMYAQSKSEAENYLLKHRRNTDLIILNPGFMLGAYDHKPSSGKIIFWVWKKQLVFYPKGGKSFVHAEDVAHAVVQSINKGKSGEKYLLVNENLSYKEFFNKVNESTGQKSTMIPIPNMILTMIGWIGDGMRKLKIKTSLCTPNMKALQVHNYYSNQKSVRELGMSYQSTDKALKDAIEYFKSLKY